MYFNSPNPGTWIPCWLNIRIDSIAFLLFQFLKIIIFVKTLFLCLHNESIFFSGLSIISLIPPKGSLYNFKISFLYFLSLFSRYFSQRQIATSTFAFDSDTSK
jgi:hypothetical protein